jgi:hypothetical protein
MWPLDPRPSLLFFKENFWESGIRAAVGAIWWPPARVSDAALEQRTSRPYFSPAGVFGTASKLAGVQTGSTWRAGKALLLLPPPASKASSIPRTQVGETGRSMLGLSEIPGRFRSMAVAGEADS